MSYTTMQQPAHSSPHEVICENIILLIRFLIYGEIVIFSCMPPLHHLVRARTKLRHVPRITFLFCITPLTLHFFHRICHSSFITNYAYRIAGNLLSFSIRFGCALRVAFDCLKEKYAHIPFGRSRAPSNFSKQIPHNFQYFSISLTRQSSLLRRGVGVASFCC